MDLHQTVDSETAWRALGDLSQVAGLDQGAVASLAIRGDDPVLPTPYRVGAAGAASHAAVGLAAAALHRARGGGRQAISISVPAAAASLRANHYLTINGERPKRPWDEMSGFYRVRGGRWVFLHCNFPNLRDSSAAVLGVAPERAAVAQACLQWDGEILETAIHEGCGCGAFVRTADEWKAHSQYAHAARLPLMEIVRIGDAPAEPLHPAPRPLDEVRVLDLTRVIAGPACGRTLAEHGADVLKVSRPDLPHSGLLDIDSGVGKSATYLDFRDPGQAEQLRTLIRTGDVFLQSYRPGALASHGLAPKDLADLRPGVIVATLTAWGHEGPWRNRRGYDTVVQSATGLADTSAVAGKPAFLPVSALDYIAGNLLALGIMRALERRATEGGSWLVRVSLLQVQHWLAGLGQAEILMHRPIQADIPLGAISRFMREIPASAGLVRYLGPVLEMDATPPKSQKPPVPLGTDPPEWQPTTELAMDGSPVGVARSRS